jgi:hypothetical protein
MGAAGIGAGTLFASLQSIAMGGVGTSGIIGGATVGGVMGLTLFHDICKQVDDLGPENWVVSSSLALIDKGNAEHVLWQRYWLEVSKDLTSEKLSSLAAVAMDDTGKTLASGVDAVSESVASAVTSLSATAAKKTKAVNVPTRQKLSMDEIWAETTGKKPSQFHGRVGHASPITVEDEIKNDLKPYGDGIDKTSEIFQQPSEERIELKLHGTSGSMSAAQERHQQHRWIRAVLKDERKHPVSSKGRK